MKRYIYICVSVLMALSSSAQLLQLSGAPANVEAVDLGLPSGTRWASCNIGAEKPEDFGYYFAWGETEPKSVFNWNNYKWMNEGQSDWLQIDKYTWADGRTDACWYKDGIFVGDYLNELLSDDDVASVYWGLGWQMPSNNQIRELIEEADWTRTTVNGVNGCKITSKTNGNSIFLPSAGGYDDFGYHWAGESGVYWSRSLFYSECDKAWSVIFETRDNDFFFKTYGTGDRYFGRSVRPVQVPTCLTITPEDGEIRFGVVKKGTDKTETFNVTNTGNAELTFHVDGSTKFTSHFEVSNNQQSFTLAPNETKIFTVTAHGLSAGYDASTIIYVKSDSNDEERIIKVSAIGDDDEPLIDETSLTLTVGEKASVRVKTPYYSTETDAYGIVDYIGGGPGETECWDVSHESYVSHHSAGVTFTALKAGVAHITFNDSYTGKSEMLTIIVNALLSVPRTYIDLGLPSGTKWANMNVGASRPEEYGKYFAWGETSAKGTYTWDNYMCLESACGKPGDPVFDLVGGKADIAGTKFDAAAFNWGASWKMPTAEQIEELSANCYSSIVTINGVQCRKLISRINGNEIIFPMAGARWYEDFAYEGTLGYYWSSTLRQGGYVSPGRLILRDTSHGWGWSMGGENDRFCAFPIRPVFVENGDTGNTVTLHKFSVVLNDDDQSEMLWPGVTFKRKGNADNYSLSTDEQQEYDPNFDISNISYITRKSIGQISLPETSAISENDLTITVDGDTISTAGQGVYDAEGGTFIATNKEGEVVYMNIAAVEDANNAEGADLNAKESAITLMLPLVPNIFVAFDDEYLPHLKEMIWDVEEVKQLAAAIDRSVVKYGYTDFGEISAEATAARNKISQLLHLDKLAEKQAEALSSASRMMMRKASGSAESPYITNTYGYGGLQVEITKSEKKHFYYPYDIVGYNCEVTAYNNNRFAYSSMVKGKYDPETNTYYIPDLGSDYDYYKNILKPQKVSTFMNTFTSFKYEDLERLGQFLEESADLIQGDIGFSEMHWSDMKKTAYFDISEQDDAIVLLFPRDNDYMMVYNILQSIIKPIVKLMSKKLSKKLDSEVIIPVLCGGMASDVDYILELESTLDDPNLRAHEKIEKITSLTWTKFFKALDKSFQGDFDAAIKESFSEFVDNTVDEVGGYEAALDWNVVKKAFKYVEWVKKIGDILTGTLGTFYEYNAVYPIHWEANGQFVLAQNAATVGEGESVKVRILVGSGSYSCESSNEETATVTGAYNKVEIHGVDAGDAVITVRDKISQKTATINVHVTGIQTFVLGASTVTVPMYEDRSVTIERGDGPFHISGGDNKIAVAKLGGGNPIIFPGEKYAVVISGVSEGTTTFNVYNEATDQTLPLTVKVTAEKVAVSDESVVDLGLSVNWANCNVGANSPEEYGDYFAWGEVESKKVFSLNNYKHYSNGNFKNIGTDISGTEYDAATHIMGNKWRMPTKAEYEELINKCEWKFVTYRGERGWKVTGPSGNSIFLPETGYKLNDWNDYESINGFYWSSNIADSQSEVHTLFTSMRDYKMSYSHMNRFEGRTIRAVTVANSDMDPVVTLDEVVDLGLSVDWLSCNIGATKPEEYGEYFAWGEITTKEDYSRDTYIWKDGKYGDAKYESLFLDKEDDVAYVTSAGKYRMPTMSELRELVRNCEQETIEYKGVKGTLLKAKNGNSIFFPYAGIINGKKKKYYEEKGCYWILGSEEGYSKQCSFSSTSWNPSCDLYEGLTVRAVREKKTQNAKMKIYTEEIDFGRIPIGGKCFSEFIIENVGTANLNVGLSIPSPNFSYEVFSVDSLNGFCYGMVLGFENKYVLMQGESAKIRVWFNPSEIGNFQTHLEFNTNAIIDDGYAFVSLIGECCSKSYEYGPVDLGLSVKWSNKNLGADSPETNGTLFAWGETESFDPNREYKWYDSSRSDWILKYYNGDTYFFGGRDRTYGDIDHKTQLESIDDAANVIMGSPWRMPTTSECDELIANTEKFWGALDGVDGCFLKGKTRECIFLPLGKVWTSTLTWGSRGGGTIQVYHYTTYDIYTPRDSDYYRIRTYFAERPNGLSIRPVMNGNVDASGH